MAEDVRPVCVECGVKDSANLFDSVVACADILGIVDKLKKKKPKKTKRERDAAQSTAAKTSPNPRSKKDQKNTSQFLEPMEKLVFKSDDDEEESAHLPAERTRDIVRCSNHATS